MKTAITVTGLVYLVRGRESTALTEPIFAGTSSNPSSFALALYSSLWYLVTFSKDYCPC